MTIGSPDGSAPLYVQLATLLEAAVLDVPGHGDRRLRLPTERQLAAIFGVSRVTVRAALDVLALRLPVRKRVGAGVFIEPAAGGAASWSMVRVTPRVMVRPSRQAGRSGRVPMSISDELTSRPTGDAERTGPVIYPSR
ncbi:hypothetical protein ASD79_10250 [Caulobacter sp. Root655]|uniref:GntR family transcriptional regulator n=1 Tax=Caulobacter sp. Root655 TaxID=1736578 RepID=UPI0006F693A5|nr:GntR family transcriptional regulator [Caulobacter sp. Root655]KRA59903.1 hypothetical protein ASD79_10250 [Caulobacter sp. Root655]